VDKNDGTKIDKEKRLEKDNESPLGTFVPWFPGLGALVVLIILRACGFGSP
jgi:hypothetical protein